MYAFRFHQLGGFEAHVKNEYMKTMFNINGKRRRLLTASTYSLHMHSKHLGSVSSPLLVEIARSLLTVNSFLDVQNLPSCPSYS